jgi:hypothetical protein
VEDNDILTEYIVRVPKDGGGWDDIDVAFLTDAQIEWLTVTNDAKLLSKTLEGTLVGVRTLVAGYSHLLGQVAELNERIDDLSAQLDFVTGYPDEEEPDRKET